MQDSGLKHGAFGWCELMTKDPAAAREFYHKLFGWELVEFPMENMNYTVVKVDGDDIGGIMDMPPGTEGMPPAWGVYVTVDDVDATAKKVAELGGSILMGPQDIPEVGRFCVIQDPQGAVISAITYVKR